MKTVSLDVHLGAGIVFDNGTQISDRHEQNCCESVYADFSHLETYNVLPRTGESITIYNIEFPEQLILSEVEGEGFCLISSDGSKWFVPCHNEQNGYYSSDLQLLIKASPGVSVSMKNETSEAEYHIDISRCVPDAEH